MAIVEKHVIDDHSRRVQLGRHLLAVRTDAADVAGGVDVHDSGGRIENLNLRVIGGRPRDRPLRAGIIERTEWIGSGVHRGRRYVRTIRRV